MGLVIDEHKVDFGRGDFLVRNAIGRSIMLTRDDDGVAHAFLNYCRHRGAEPAQGCGSLTSGGPCVVPVSPVKLR